VVPWGVIVATIQTTNTVLRIVNDRSARQHEAMLQQRQLDAEREGQLIQGGVQLASDAIVTFGPVVAQRGVAKQQRLEREFQRAQVEQAQQFQAELAQLRHEFDTRLEEWTAALQAKSAQQLAEYQRMLDGYPMGRPGHLRASRALVRPDLSTVPPLVLLPPPYGDESSARRWGDMRTRIENDLDALQSRGLVVIQRLDRPLTWPHHDFYTHDLAGIPTIVVQLSHDLERLSVRLGGCHLGPPDPGPVQDLQLVLELRYRPVSEWTPALLDTLNRTSHRPARYDLAAPLDEVAVQQLNHELASRLVTLAVTAAVDSYHLLTKPGYDEQVDAAVEAAGISPEEWPADSSQPLDQIADPAYHLLHVAARLLRRGDQEAALRAVRAALELFTHAAPGRPWPELRASVAGSPVVRPWHLRKLVALGAESGPQPPAELTSIAQAAAAALPAVEAHGSGHLPTQDRRDSWDPSVSPV
jgi:hypothetical protein